MDDSNSSNDVSQLNIYDKPEKFRQSRSLFSASSKKKRMSVNPGSLSIKPQNLLNISTYNSQTKTSANKSSFIHTGWKDKRHSVQVQPSSSQSKSFTLSNKN